MKLNPRNLTEWSELLPVMGVAVVLTAVVSVSYTLFEYALWVLYGWQFPYLATVLALGALTLPLYWSVGICSVLKAKGVVKK